MKDPPDAVAQLPEYQGSSQGLSVPLQQTTAAGTEVCWEHGSHGLVVRTTQALLERHMGKGRDVWKILGTPSFPPPALSLSQRDVGTSSCHKRGQMCSVGTATARYVRLETQQDSKAHPSLDWCSLSTAHGSCSLCSLPVS